VCSVPPVPGVAAVRFLDPSRLYKLNSPLNVRNELMNGHVQHDGSDKTLRYCLYISLAFHLRQPQSSFKSRRMRRSDNGANLEAR
jgi:hypothetical protein